VEGISPFAVSQFLLDKASQERTGLSPMKLIKMVYIAHGWNLGFTGEPLIYEPIQAWQYGPVVESLYHGFKQYGNSPIDAASECLPAFPADAPDKRDLLGKIWAKYSPLSAVHLSALTHQTGTPWDVVWNKQGGNSRKGAVIDNDIIKEYYAAKRTQSTGSGH
jgi:uncharacterized phage-associated protein